jgi:N-acetylneuraminic acid mutarotase
MKAGSPRWDPNAKVIVPPAKLAWSELKQAAPPPRAGTAMAEGPNDSVVLFGGVGENGALNDTWVFSGGVWTEAKPKSPPGVLGAALMVFDAKRQVSVLVGIDMSTHEWDGTEWREVKTPAAPPMRQEFSLAYDVRNQVVTLFGGLDPASRKYFNDVWTYDGAAWKQLDMKSTPMARHGAAMAWSPANGALLLFGGRNYYGRYVDTWLFDGKTWTMQTPADSPAACENMLMAASATAAVMVCSAPADDNSATWQWTGKNWLKGPDLPKSRAQGGIAFDKAAKAIIVLGGACGTGPLHDCWALSDVR